MVIIETFAPVLASEIAASQPMKPEPITTRRSSFGARSRIRSASAMRRIVLTGSRSAGMRSGTSGREPVARTQASKPTREPSSTSTSPA